MTFRAIIYAAQSGNNNNAYKDNKALKNEHGVNLKHQEFAELNY